MTTARGKRGSNFAEQSQGNLLVKQGIEYRKAHGGFKIKVSPTFAGYGSPVNTKDMSDTLKKVGFKNTGMVTHTNDAVGEVLGGNKGVNKQMDAGSRIKAIVNVPKLFTPDSPHSTYKCSENPNAKCGDRP